MTMMNTQLTQRTKGNTMNTHTVAHILISIVFSWQSAFNSYICPPRATSGTETTPVNANVHFVDYFKLDLIRQYKCKLNLMVISPSADSILFKNFVATDRFFVDRRVRLSHAFETKNFYSDGMIGFVNRRSNATTFKYLDQTSIILINLCVFLCVDSSMKYSLFV